MSGTLFGKLRAEKLVETTWSRWVQVWEQRSGRRIIKRLRRTWQFDSRFEQLEPRQMLDAAGGGTGSQPPEIEFSYLGLPTEVAELAAPFFDNGSEFSESSLSFPTEQIVDNGDSPPVQNIFQVKATPWNNLSWADHMVTTTADDNDGTTKLVQLRQLDDGNTLVLFRSITVGTTFQTGGGGGGGAGYGGGGSTPAVINRSTDAWFVALVTDEVTAQSIQSSNSLVPLSPSLFGFTLLVESDFGYNRSNSSGYSNFTVVNDMSVDMDINWNSDVTQSYEMGDEFDNDATLQVVTDATAAVNQTHHWVYTGQALASGDYSSNRPWTKSGSGTTSYTATSGTVWDMNYSEGDVSADDGLEFQFTVTENFSTTANHAYNYSGSGTAAGDSMGGYQMATRNEIFVRSGDSTTDDSPVTEFTYHSVGSNLELVEPDEDDGTGDGGEGGNSGGGGSETPPAPIEVTVFHNDTFTSTFSPVYQGDHDYTTNWTSLRAVNGDWSESLVTNETNDFDTTGTVYSDTTSLNSISTSSRTGTAFHQLVDFTAASGAHTVVTTSSDMDFTGATGQEMVVSGTINVDSQVDNLVDNTSLSSDVVINTLRVSGEYSDGVQALLPSDWQGILGTIDTYGGAAVDWDWLGGGTVSALLLDMAITDYSSTENDFSTISPLTPPATPVSTYGTEIEFLIDGTIRFTSTGDSAWINGFSGTSDVGTKTVFVKGTAPDADTLDWMFSETNSNDASTHNGTFSSSDLENVTVTSTPEYDTDPDPNSSGGSGGGGGGSNSGPDQITGYDSVVSGTTQRLVSSGSIYNNSNGGFVSTNARTDDYEGNKTDVSFGFTWQQQSTTTGGFTSGSWTTFGGIDGPFLTTNTIAGGNTSTTTPVDNYSISSHVRKETDDGFGGTSIDDVSSYQPWNGGGSFGVIWDQNTTLTLTETPIDFGEEDPENPGDGTTDEPTTYLKISLTGDSNIWTTGDTNHDLDGDLAKLRIEIATDSNPSGSSNMTPEPSQNRSEIYDADEMSGSEGSTSTMHTRTELEENETRIITNGTTNVWQKNKTRFPIEIGGLWMQADPGNGTSLVATFVQDGFLTLEQDYKQTTTANDWTVSIEIGESGETTNEPPSPLTGSDLYRDSGNGISVSGTMTTVEDLKLGSKLQTEINESLVGSGNTPEYRNSELRHATTVATIDRKEHSITTTTIVAIRDPDGDSLSQTVALELPEGENKTTWDVTRTGNFFKANLWELQNGYGGQHINVLEGQFDTHDSGFTEDKVIGESASVTTTRDSDGNWEVAGSIEIETEIKGDATANANSIWVDGYAFGNSPGGSTNEQFVQWTDEVAGGAGDGSLASAAAGTGTQTYDLDLYDVGVVTSRDLNVHYEGTRTSAWSVESFDSDSDQILDAIRTRTSEPEYTTTIAGSDTRNIVHYGVDNIGAYYQTENQSTDIGTAENRSGFIAKARSMAGDKTTPGRMILSSGGEPPVDDSESDYSNQEGTTPPPDDDGTGDNQEGSDPNASGDAKREFNRMGMVDLGGGDYAIARAADGLKINVIRSTPSAFELLDRALGGTELLFSFGAGIAEGIFVDGIGGTASTVCSIAWYFGTHSYEDIFIDGYLTSMSVLDFIKNNPVVYAVYNDIDVLTGRASRELSPITVAFLTSVRDEIKLIVTTIGEELGNMENNQIARLTGRIVGGILLGVATGSFFSAAAKGGRIANMVDDLPLSTKAKETIHAAIQRIAQKVEVPDGGGWLNDAMIGFKDGELIPDSVLARLSSRLNRNNVSIIKNEWAQEILEKSGDGAQFVRFNDGSAGILLRPNATRYQLVHELKHYEHWLADPEEYAKLSKLAREEFVFKALQESNHWKIFTDAERTHALEYIEYIRRLYGN